MSSIYKFLTYSNIIKYSIYILIIFFIFSKEYLVLNEEFLIILSFFAVFGGLQQALSNLLTEELNDRTLQIKKQFLALYKNKEQFQQILITLLEKKIILADNLKSYQNLLDKSLLEMINNRNIIFNEVVNLYVEQLLTTYLLKYNLELKNIYLTTLAEIEEKLS